MRASSHQQKQQKQQRQQQNGLRVVSRGRSIALPVTVAVACLCCASSAVLAEAFAPSALNSVAFGCASFNAGSSTRQWMAFGLPDELPPTSASTSASVTETSTTDTSTTEADATSSIADETLESLTKKLDRSATTGKTSPKPPKDNKAMQFLKKIGKVGGAANKSFVNAVGSDEGSTGRQPAAARGKNQPESEIGAGIQKSKLAYIECTKSGIIDDLTQPFPVTTCGREWRGISDRVMGGVSNGVIRREPDLHGRPANILTGQVSLENNGGFLQMVTDLALDPSTNSVDASDYDGIEIDVLYRPPVDSDSDIENGGESDNSSAKKLQNSFNVHLRTPGTLQQASYRHTFQIDEPDAWETIRIPFSSFQGYSGRSGMPLPPLDISQLRRIGIVAIGQQMELFLAVGGARFYSVI